MAVEEKVRAEEFHVETSMSVDALREAVRSCVDDNRRAFSSSMTAEESGNGFDIIEKGPGGLVTRLWLRLSWETNGVATSVSLRVSEYLTIQDRIFFFIPFGPKSAPALGALRRLSACLRERIANVA